MNHSGESREPKGVMRDGAVYPSRAWSEASTCR
jgi:hypothetical protein